MNRMSLSTGWLPRLSDRPFYELSSVIDMMKRFSKESHVDGFEFALLPEWDSESPPLTPTSAPSGCEKHTIEEVLDILTRQDFSILSVHANRDVGSYLCSGKPEQVAKGIKLMDESLRFTQTIKSPICVFHFWDPWKKHFDLPFLKTVYNKYQMKYRKTEISIENIPTLNRLTSPYELMQSFRYKTLDLKWASMADEFDRFVDTIEQVDNVHIQGRYQNGVLAPTIGILDYETALKRIKETSYEGIFTVELEGKVDYDTMLRCIDKLREYLK
jgi:sugar phosphate isomerase/epimerase